MWNLLKHKIQKTNEIILFFSCAYMPPSFHKFPTTLFQVFRLHEKTVTPSLRIFLNISGNSIWHISTNKHKIKFMPKGSTKKKRKPTARTTLVVDLRKKKKTLTAELKQINRDLKSLGCTK